MRSLSCWVTTITPGRVVFLSSTSDQITRINVAYYVAVHISSRSNHRSVTSFYATDKDVHRPEWKVGQSVGEIEVKNYKRKHKYYKSASLLKNIRSPTFCTYTVCKDHWTLPYEAYSKLSID